MIKKAGLVLVICLGFGGIAFAVDSTIDEAVTYLYLEKITKYDDVTLFRPDSNITREEAAKFFSQYTLNTTNKLPNKNKSCDFFDIQTADATLRTNIITACQLGIFQGAHGNFYPKKKLTIGEMSAILSRIKFGYLNELGSENPIYFYNWYDNYTHEIINRLGIANIGNNDGMKSATRGLVAKSMFNMEFKIDIKSYVLTGYITSGYIDRSIVEKCPECKGYEKANILYILADDKNINLPYGYENKAPIGEIYKNSRVGLYSSIPLLHGYIVDQAKYNLPVTIELFYEMNIDSIYLDGDKNPLIYFKVLR